MSPRHTFVGPRVRGFASATLLVAAAVLHAPDAMAQSAPSSLADARKAWATAVQRGDGQAAAALAVLPLQYEGYQAPKTIQRAAYLREVSDWSSLKSCLATERMERVKGRSRLGTYTFNCDGHGFFFAEKNGVWRHTGYENTNE